MHQRGVQPNPKSLRAGRRQVTRLEKRISNVTNQQTTSLRELVDYSVADPSFALDRYSLQRPMMLRVREIEIVKIATESTNARQLLRYGSRAPFGM